MKNKIRLLILIIGIGLIGTLISISCGREFLETVTVTITGKIDFGAVGEGPRAKVTENIFENTYDSIKNAIEGLKGIKSATVDENGNFTLELSIPKTIATKIISLLFTRNRYYTETKEITYTEGTLTYDLGIIPLEADAESLIPEALPSTAGRICLLKQTRNPDIPYGDDTGRIGPDPNDIYSARQINTDVNIQTNQWYTLRVTVVSTEGSARIKAYLNDVLVIDEIDSTPYVRDYYSDLRNGNFAIEASPTGIAIARIVIDDVIVTKEGTVFSDDFESGFHASSQEGEATWWAMNGTWEVITDETSENHYIQGETETTRYQAFLFYPSHSDKTLYRNWVNYSVQLKFRLLNSNSRFHLRVRHRFNDDPALSGNTYIGNTCYRLVVEP